MQGQRVGLFPFGPDAKISLLTPMVYHRCPFTLQGGERTAPREGFCPGKQRDDSLLPSNLKAYDPTGKYFIA